jgi:hypothetical protein
MTTPSGQVKGDTTLSNLRAPALTSGNTQVTKGPSSSIEVLDELGCSRILRLSRCHTSTVLLV